MSEEMDYAQLVAQEDEINLLRKQVEKLEAELETERMRLAACGVVALANTPESAAKARDMLPEYYSGSCEDVAQAVDREMALRDRAEQLEAELECAKADYLNACVTIANMHRAAVGEVTGPKRGVVEDIEDLRLEQDALLASKPLEAENKRLRGHIEQLREAVEEGLSTYKVPMTARICEAITALAQGRAACGESIGAGGSAANDKEKANA